MQVIFRKKVNIYQFIDIITIYFVRIYLSEESHHQNSAKTINSYKL